MQYARGCCWATGLLLGCTLLGCGQSDYSVAPVSGTVTVDGEPTAKIRVTFQPIASDGNINPGPAAVGVTDASGHYEAKLILPEGEQLGAVVGPHRVRFFTGQVDPSELTEEELNKIAMGPMMPESVLPPGEEGKEVEFEVPPEGTDSADFAFPME